MYTQTHSHRVSEKKSEQPADENVAADDKGNSVVFDFDQVDRHRKFWDFLRNKEWQAVATFLEKKVRAIVVWFKLLFLRVNLSVYVSLRCWGVPFVQRKCRFIVASLVVCSLQLWLATRVRSIFSRPCSLYQTLHFSQLRRWRTTGTSSCGASSAC